MMSEAQPRRHTRTPRHMVTSELTRHMVSRRPSLHIPKLTKTFLVILMTSGMLIIRPALASPHQRIPDAPLSLLLATTSTFFLTLWSARPVRSAPPQDHVVQDIMESKRTAEEKFKAVLQFQHRRYCQTSRTCLRWEYGSCGYCRPCQCDDQCLDYGDCCPDKLLQDVEEVQPITIPLACRDNLYAGYTEEQRQSRLSNATSFLMTASCPPSAPAGLVGSCVSPSNYLPVSVPDRVGGGGVEVFANKHCAECHGVEGSQAAQWKMFLHCASEKNFTTAKGQGIALQAAQDRDCFLVYFPPPSLPSPRQCYYDDTMITSCNVTGAWPEPDPFTERACAAYLDPKLAEGRLFQNVFCYICNSAEPELFSLCERTSVLAPMRFSALLDFSGAIYGESMSARTAKCPESEIYDDTTDQCRQVLCAPGRQYMDGRCFPVFATARLLTYSLYFSVMVDRDLDLYDGNDLLHRLPGRLEAFVMFEMLKGSVRPTSFQVSFEITDEDGRCSQKSRQFSVFCTFEVMQDVKQEDFERHLLQLRNTSSALRMTSSLSLNFTTKVDERIWLRQKSSANQMAGRSCSTSVSNFYPVLEGDAEATNSRVTQLLTSPKVALTHDEFHVETSDLGVKVPWLEEPIPLERYESTDEGKIYIGLGDFMPKVTAYRKSLSEAEEAEVILSVVCTSLSLAGLTLTLFTYSLFKPLRTAPGKNNINLCTTLFLAQLFYLVGSGRNEVPGLCQAMGILIHYLWLAAFAAMSVCSYHMWRVFTSFKTDDDMHEQRRFLHYTIYIWSSAAIVVVLTLFGHMIVTGGDEIGYGGQHCYLSTAVGVGAAVGLPVALTLVANVTFFALTVRTIRLSPKLLSKSREDERHVWVYLKLSTLIGLTWTLAFVVFFTEVQELRYLFTVVNGLQGVFVCLSFVFNRRVTKLYLACCKGSHSRHSATTSSTSSRNGHVSTISRRTETSFTDTGGVKA